MIKAGFIGAGGRGRDAHYPALSRIEGVEIVAVCELDQERMKIVVDQYGIEKTFTDHREMLATVDLDVVYCVMREWVLLQPALDCLNAGKHLFIEKPPGATTVETQQMLDAAIASDVHVCVGLQRRYAAVTREAMRRVAEKGPISTASATFNKQMLGGDGKEFSTTLWNDVVHVVDLLRYLAGGEPTEVTAYRDSFGSASRNCYTSLIRFDNGVSGVLFGNRASGGRVLRSELHGTGIGCYTKIPEEIEIHEDDKSTTMGGWEVDGVDEKDERRYDGTLTMHEHFLDCIRTGDTPITDLRDVVNTMRLVDQIEGPRP
jgi:virulence factor